MPVTKYVEMLPEGKKLHTIPYSPLSFIYIQLFSSYNILYYYSYIQRYQLSHNIQFYMTRVILTRVFLWHGLPKHQFYMSGFTLTPVLYVRLYSDTSLYGKLYSDTSLYVRLYSDTSFKWQALVERCSDFSSRVPLYCSIFDLSTDRDYRRL